MSVQLIDDGYPLLIGQLLLTARNQYPDRPISGPDGYTGNYAALDTRIARLAGALAELGVRPGTTVAVADWDSHRYLECYFAIPMSGAVLMMVNIRLSDEQILYTLNDCGAEVLIVHADFLPLVTRLRDRLPHVRHVVPIADSGASQPDVPFELAPHYEQLLARAAPMTTFPELDERTRATTFYTTGTTGAPKGVFYSHRQLVLHTLGLAAALCASPEGQRAHRDDVYMPITPMFHVHAWGFPYLATLLGMAQVYPGRYEAGALLARIRAHKVTLSHCVPALLKMVLDEADRQGDTDTLRGWKLLVGGSALPGALARRARDTGVDVWVGYGMSETCPVIALSRVEAPASEDEDIAQRCRTGQPLPLVDLRVVDEDMHDVARDDRQQGELVVRAPWLTRGYLNRPEDSQALWAGGYLHTQDIGVIDAKHRLRVTDRLKDVIKSGGEWISSLALENIVASVPDVTECAVIGVGDARWGERPLVLVVARAGGEDGLPARILQALQDAADAGALPRYGVPEANRIRLVDALPRTSVGKLDKKAMRSRNPD